MAGGSTFDITVSGVGAHGARPESGIDPVSIAAQIITAIQTIVSRTLPPQDTAVLSVTRVQAGDAYNVIPSEARLSGTARAFRREIMDLLEARLRRTAEGVAEAMGGSATLEFREVFAPLFNDAEEAEFAADCAAALSGEDAVDRHRDVIMGSEDFSYMLAERPGAYINIGMGEDHAVQVHNPAYRFNDAVLPVGAAYLASLVENRLTKN